MQESAMTDLLTEFQAEARAAAAAKEQLEAELEAVSEQLAAEQAEAREVEAAKRHAEEQAGALMQQLQALEVGGGRGGLPDIVSRRCWNVLAYNGAGGTLRDMGGRLVEGGAKGGLGLWLGWAAVTEAQPLGSARRGLFVGPTDVLEKSTPWGLFSLSVSLQLPSVAG
jgi:hypothetical protein